MKQYKSLVISCFLTSACIFAMNSISAQNGGHSSMTVEGGNLFLSAEERAGPGIYAEGDTWTGLKDHNNQWVFLAKNDSYTSLKSGCSKLKLFPDGKVDFIGTPVKLSYMAYEFEYDYKDYEYAALIPENSDKVLLGTSENYFFGVYTNKIYRNEELTLSDKRVKDNVKDIDNALDKVLALKGHSYTFNSHYPFIKKAELDKTKTNLGFIAQELQEVIPEMVVEDKNTGFLMVQNYEQLFPVVVEAMKEQQRQIEEKDAIIIEIMSRLERIEKALKAKTPEDN